MSEINDEGLLPPDVHHARPEKPGQPDEEADRERAVEETEPSEAPEEGDRGHASGEHAHPTPQAPHVPGDDERLATDGSQRRPRHERSDDPYAKEGEDPYADPPRNAPGSVDREQGGDPGRVDGRTDADSAPEPEHLGPGSTGAQGTGEPPD